MKKIALFSAIACCVIGFSCTKEDVTIRRLVDVTVSDSCGYTLQVAGVTYLPQNSDKISFVKHDTTLNLAFQNHNTKVKRTCLGVTDSLPQLEITKVYPLDYTGIPAKAK